MTENTKTQFTYDEWHFVWKAVEARCTKYWALVERFQIASKENPQEDTYLWIHFLELAEDQNDLLNKVEKIANEHFPITTERLFPIVIHSTPKKEN